MNGAVHILDLSAHAMASTAQNFKAFATTEKKTSSTFATLERHEGAITCLALLSTNVIVSGGKDGTVRFWDESSRSCIKIVTPWQSNSAIIPVSDLLVVSEMNELENETNYDLQPFELHRKRKEHENLVFSLAKRKCDESFEFDEDIGLKRYRLMKGYADGREQSGSSSQQSDDLTKLKLELDEAKNTIKRWQNVNNKLVTKMKKLGNNGTKS